MDRTKSHEKYDKLNKRHIIFMIRPSLDYLEFDHIQ